MKIIMPFCLVILLISCKKEEITLEKNNFNISSEYTGFEYQITVLYPENFDKSKNYQTVYFLDGRSYQREFFSIVNSDYRNNLVLVSVSYKTADERDTDFTYPAHEKDFKFGGSVGFGGANKFIQFFNEELIPYIENDLSIQSIERTIYGHSLGGYFCLYTMLQEEFDSPFDNYISVSSSLFYGDSYLFDLEQEYALKNDSLPAKLYFGMGDLEATAQYTAFRDILKKRNYINFDITTELIKRSGHNNTQSTGFKNGLKFILN